MKYLSNAKINLNLMINGIDDKGYHLLYSVVAPIDLYDEIEINLIEEDKIVIECSNKDVPLDEKNIIVKCIKELKKEKKIEKGVYIKLIKNIPLEAGLGGGSSNGATVLKALNSLLTLSLSEEKLMEIGSKVGADIPFFIKNKISLIEGYGERVKNIEKGDFNPFILLVKPNVGISTKEAFNLYDKMIKTKEYTPLDLHLKLKNNNKEEIYPLLKNDLQKVAINLIPELENIPKKLVEFGARVCCMSGSGSCFYAVFEEEELLKKAKKELAKIYDFVKITKIL